MKRTFVLGSLALVLSGFAGENLCLNGDLEKGTEGWTFPDSSYRVEQGAGINGSAAIVFEAKEGRKHDGPRYEIKAKPGRVYRFSGRIKRDTVTNVVQIALVRMTKDHGWITQVVADQTDVNAVNTDGWTLFEGQTAFLDSESAILRLYIYIRNGACGRFCADDFRIEELPEDPLGDLQSSGYRNAAVSGDVTFAVPVRVNPFERKLETLTAELAYKDAAGASRVAKMRIADDLAKATLDAAAFAMGSQTVVVTLKDAAGVQLDTASLPFTRLAAEPNYPVRVDGKGRFVVNGKPFFPIGITWGMSIKRKEWTEAMAKFGNGPFNMVMVYEHDITPKDLDFFLANGMMVKYNLKDVYTGFSQVHPPAGVKTREDEIRYVTEKVRELKDHPGLFAWYTNDEFPPTMADRVRERCALLNRLDPTHPVSVCLCRPYTISAFNGGFDIISSDPYPIGHAVDSLSLAATWTRITSAQTYGLKPMLQTTQAFDWSWFPGNFKNPHFPTYEELRSMTWQLIAEGATGVNYFSYSCIYANLKGEAFDRAWGDTKRVASEVKEMAPVLLSDEPAPHVTVDPDALSLKAWRLDGKVYLAVCDLTGKASAPRLQVPGRYASVTCRDGAEATLAAGGALELKLPPFGVALVRLTPAE